MKGVKVVNSVNLRAIKERIKSLGESSAMVGVTQSTNSSSTHKGINNATLASIHEFGTGNNPERSFLRSTLIENQSVYAKHLASIAETVASGESSYEVELNKLALLVAGDVKQRISNNDIKPSSNKEGGGVTLLDTGSLMQAITGEVRKS